MAGMNLALNKVDVVNLFVEDLAGTSAFYQEIFGLRPAFEDDGASVFTFENVTVCLTDASGARDLVAPAAVASSGAGSRFVLAAFVDDVEAACAELEQRGVALLNGPVDRPWGVRTAAFADPAGHIWEIAQDLD